MAKYIRLDQLMLYLQSLEKMRKDTMTAEAARPYQKFMNCTVHQIYEELRFWASENAIEGTIMLDPWPNGGGVGSKSPCLSNRWEGRLEGGSPKPEQNKNFVQVEGGEKGL